MGSETGCALTGCVGEFIVLDFCMKTGKAASCCDDVCQTLYTCHKGVTREHNEPRCCIHLTRSF